MQEGTVGVGANPAPMVYGVHAARDEFSLASSEVGQQPAPFKQPGTYLKHLDWIHQRYVADYR
jgi:hypothetical protein